MKKIVITIITVFIAAYNVFAIEYFRTNEPELIYIVDSIDYIENDLIVKDSTGHAFLIKVSPGDMFLLSYNGEGINYFMSHPDDAYIFNPDLLESLQLGYNSGNDYSDYIGRYYAWHKNWLRKIFDKYAFKESPKDVSKYPMKLNKKLPGDIEYYCYPPEQGPDYYLLLLMRGDFYNYLAVTNHSCGGPIDILHLPDPKAYYKIVVPVWEEMIVKPEDES